MNREFEEIKNIEKYLERLKGYACGEHKQLEKQMINRIKKLKARVKEFEKHT